jgi:hypothetical protein
VARADDIHQFTDGLQHTVRFGHLYDVLCRHVHADDRRRWPRADLEVRSAARTGVCRPAPPSDPGLYYRDANGATHYAPMGTFEKEADKPAIYVVAYGQLHTFSAWGQFLRWGDHTDLSNVQVYGHIDPSLIGQPATD